MENTMFRPAALQEDTDPVARSLLRIAQNTLVVVFGLFPLIFIPVAYAPLQYSKVLFVLVGVVIALIFYSLSVLREGEISLSAPLALIALWGVTVAYVISTILSGDLKDAFVGNGFEAHTTAFLLLLAVIASTGLILRGSKTAIIRLYSLLIGSGIVLALYHLVRVIFGADTLTFGIFTSLTSSPLGSWNGLALYFGLIALLALVAFDQLPLARMGKWLLGVSAVLSLLMLALVNNFTVWVVIAGVSTIMLMYSLAQKHYQRTEPMVGGLASGSFASIIFATVLLIVSLVFILGGSVLATVISEQTGIQYIEVRPSVSATFDMARHVYNESPIFGVGPNKFADVWRMYKDPSINQTIFWNSNFDSGSGFIPTGMVTTGILGLLGWLTFLALLLFTGFRMIFRASHTDRFWSFVGLSSFIAAVYLWGMAIFYTPSVAILMLAAVCTSVFLAAHGVLMTQSRATLSVANNRAFGVVFVGVVVLVIFGSVGTLYMTGQHYSALFEFNRTFATIDEEDTIETIQERIMSAYELSSNDIFARRIAEYRLAQVNSLLNLAEPSETEVATFQQAVADGLNAADIATQVDPTEPMNWRILGQIYSVLTSADVADAYERASVAYDRAQQYDPNNPSILLLRAELEAHAGNMEEARQLAEEAVRMKRNYTEALLFLTQIDILNNDVEQAIERTQSIISIEPRNPARYYQLGILESAAGDTATAITAFERAVALDPQYANARYYLALSYVEQNRRDDALEQLAVVAELNPDNNELRTLISRIQSGEPINAESTSSLEAEDAVLEDGAEVTKEALSETSLVTPVNTVPDDARNEEDETSSDVTETTAAGE